MIPLLGKGFELRVQYPKVPYFIRQNRRDSRESEQSIYNVMSIRLIGRVSHFGRLLHHLATVSISGITQVDVHLDDACIDFVGTKLQEQCFVDSSFVVRITPFL